jgi:hypothetical protein
MKDNTRRVLGSLALLGASLAAIWLAVRLPRSKTVGVLEVRPKGQLRAYKLRAFPRRSLPAGVR